MKSEVRLIAEGRIFQVGLYDGKSAKRVVAVYVCGTEVFWADNSLSLFDRDQRRPAPPWLRDQLLSPKSGTILLDWRGEPTNGKPVDRAAEKEFDETTVAVPPGASLDDEDSIKQG